MLSRFVASARRVYPVIKRSMDVVIAGLFIILLSPLLLIAALLVKLTSDGPVIFYSDRLGLDGNVFRMPKFRTMTTCSRVMSRETATDADIKLTPIGNLLRKSSIDELPQLWSVVKGDMSLIGPRPLIPNDNANDLRMDNPVIYTVRPGITGLAQINGRSFIKPQNKVRYDAFYAQRVCMILDIKILSRTFITIFDTKSVK